MGSADGPLAISVVSMIPVQQLEFPQKLTKSSFCVPLDGFSGYSGNLASLGQEPFSKET
jgi:hypothetical protein